jgi:hypothetical protein
MCSRSLHLSPTRHERRVWGVARTIGIEEGTDRIGRELSRKAAFYLIAFAADRDVVRKAGGFL